MKPYKRGKHYYIDVRWRGLPRIRLSTRTSLKARAQAMANTVIALREAGRADLLTMLADGRLDLPDVHAAFIGRRDELEQLKAKAESPALGPLVDEWLAHLRSPAGVSPRTKRPYAPQTIRRYDVSWEGFFELLPHGRDAQISDLTSGFWWTIRIPASEPREATAGMSGRIEHDHQPRR